MSHIMYAYNFLSFSLMYGLLGQYLAEIQLLENLESAKKSKYWENHL